MPWGPELWPFGMTPCSPSNFPRSSSVGWTCWPVSELPSSRGDKGRVRSCQLLVSVQCPVPETVGLGGHFHLGDDDDEEEDEIQSQRPLTKLEVAAEGTHDALDVATGDCQLSGNHHGFLESRGPERSPDRSASPRLQYLFLFSLHNSSLGLLDCPQTWPPCFHLRAFALAIPQLEEMYPRYMPGSLSHLLRALLKDLFSTRPIVTTPLNIAIESFSPFPALFFCTTLLRTDMLHILLISVVYCLYPTPNSKHHESGVPPPSYIPSPVTGRCLIDICGISEHLFTLHPL